MLLLATASVTISRQIEDILNEAESHPNSVYSQINKHSNNKALRIFYQTGVSDCPAISFAPPPIHWQEGAKRDIQLRLRCEFFT